MGLKATNGTANIRNKLKTTKVAWVGVERLKRVTMLCIVLCAPDYAKNNQKCVVFLYFLSPYFWPTQTVNDFD